MARGSPSTSSYFSASPESQLRNSSTNIRTGILASTTMRYLYQGSSFQDTSPPTPGSLTGSTDARRKGALQERLRRVNSVSPPPATRELWPKLGDGDVKKA